MLAEMDNQELGKIFREIADILSIQGEDRFRINAYIRAAEAIEHHPVELKDLWKEGRLGEVPGVGEAIAKKIDEIFRTGKLKYLQDLRREVPPGVVSLLSVPDIGPKTAKLLWKELGITSVAKVEKAAKAGLLRDLPGLGARSEERILQGIEMMKRLSGRLLLSEASPVAEEFIAHLQAKSPVEKVEAVGSLRRRKPTIGDVDILATSKKPSKVMEAFTKYRRVAQVLSQGSTKSSVVLDNGLQVDLLVLPNEKFGAALVYFTGSKEHTVELRELALTQGLSLSEHGFVRLKDKKEILCPTEEEVYQKLGLQWIPPEMREAAGEIEAARKGTLPKLVSEKDIRGDLQMHTKYS
ncbi:MAG: DNA polymerase III, partial [Chloroflexi bacterium]|nr:DNA polymerase III [Chloroflexota bacterium]